jgi:hypothetical protein
MATKFLFEISWFSFTFTERQLSRNVIMYRKLGVWFLIGLFAVGSLGFASIDGVTKRIKFAKGKNSATISGAVIRGDLDTYLVGARAGQRMTVRVTALEDNAAFSIKGPDGEFLDGAGEMDDATNVVLSLPQNGDYRIVVGGTRGNATYKLTVSIK